MQCKHFWYWLGLNLWHTGQILTFFIENRVVDETFTLVVIVQHDLHGNSCLYKIKFSFCEYEIKKDRIYWVKRVGSSCFLPSKQNCIVFPSIKEATEKDCLRSNFRGNIQHRMHLQLLIIEVITALALKILFSLHTHAGPMLMCSSGFIIKKSNLFLREKHREQEDEL